MIREEFERLIRAFEEGASGKTIDLRDVFAQTMEFFEHLKEMLRTGNVDEKKEALKMMTELYQKMVEETKRVCERSGLSEEQLLAIAENPKNFTPDQWRLIEECKEKIVVAGENLKKTLQPMIEEGGGTKPAAPSPEGKKGASSIRRQGKSKWMRS